MDCGKTCFITDEYIVRNSVWAEAGMAGWDAGYLHLECLEKRIGRKARWGDDLLVRAATPWTERGMKCEAHPDYLSSPEFLEHSGPSPTPPEEQPERTTGT